MGGDRVIAYQKMIDLVEEYLGKTNDADESERFCNSYMNMYYELSDKLSVELPENYYEAFDELNLICDSYEKNPEIREADKFCIDEKQLREKIIFYLNRIKR